MTVYEFGDMLLRTAEVLPMRWYYAVQNKRKGPIEETELDELVRSGALHDDTLVWREGMVEWQTHVAACGPRMQQAVPDARVETFKYCVQCGGKFPASELVMIGPNSVCAICKPTFSSACRKGARRSARHAMQASVSDGRQAD